MLDTVEVSHNVYQIDDEHGNCYIFYADRGDLYNSDSGALLAEDLEDLEEAEYLITYDFV